MGDQSGLRFLRDRRDRVGASVSPGGDRSGNRRRAGGLLDPLCGSYRRRKLGRPGPGFPLVGDVDTQHRAHRGGNPGADTGEPRIRHHSGRGLPGNSGWRPSPPSPDSRSGYPMKAWLAQLGRFRPTGLRHLDRYVLQSWIRIFVLTALGFPLVSILINLTDTLNRLLDRGLTMKQIAVSYVYSVPENAFLVMPAAVLFATVFTVGAMGRHSELTAAKAGGQSFHRLMRPVFLASCAAAALAFLVGELAPGATARQLEIQKARQARPTSARFNFVYRGDQGWVYTIRALDVSNRQLKGLMFERQGTGLSYPGLVLTADKANYDNKLKAWRLRNGASRVIAGPGKQATFTFRTMRLKALRQSPADLMAEPKAPDEMGYAELGRYIEALKRSGNDANKLMVDKALKLALPVTCLIIALFGAPLAVSQPRAGAAVGIAISLATTVIFLLLTQIMKAVGAGGVINPIVAAWFPNVLFLFMGLVLLGKVRT